MNTGTCTLGTFDNDLAKQCREMPFVWCLNCQIYLPNSLEYYNFAKAIIKAPSRYFCSHIVHVGSNLDEFFFSTNLELKESCETTTYSVTDANTPETR